MKKMAATIASLGIVASNATFISMNASAAETYTPVQGTEFKFGKYLVMENDASVPNVTFDFKVAPASGTDLNNSDESAFSLYAGPSGIKFKTDAEESVTVSGESDTNAQVVFLSENETIPESERGDKTISFITDSSREDEKYAEKTLTLDLSGVTFSKPGVYRYVITETAAGSIAGVKPDEENKRYLDYYVLADEDGNLRVEGHVFYVDSTRKSTGFTNQYLTNNLIFEKKVTGNQGSKDKHFKFTVQLTNEDGLTVNDDDVFKIIGNFEKEFETAEGSLYTTDVMEEANNIDTITYAQLKAGHDFYLCSGHNIEIKGIPLGLGYKITEYQEKYSPEATFSSSSDSKTNDKDDEGTAIDGITVTGDTSAANTFYVQDSYLKNNTDVTFTNTLTGVIPTGILMSVAGAAGIVAIGATGIVCGCFFAKKKSEED